MFLDKFIEDFGFGFSLYLALVFIFGSIAVVGEVRYFIHRLTNKEDTQ